MDVANTLTCTTLGRGLLLIMLALSAACSTPARVHVPDSDVLELRHKEIYDLASLPPAEMRIAPGDSLRIVRDAQQAGVTDETSVFAVRPDGYFSMPYLGPIKAAGRTLNEITEDVTNRYAKIYRQPQVTVNIASAPSNRVFVGGAVPNPTAVEVNGNLTVEQVLIASGGVLSSADSDNVALLRAGDDGKYKMYFFSLASMLTDPSRPMITMQRGDIIYVPQSGIGSAVEAVDMYFTRLIPINKGIGVGLNYDLKSRDVNNSGNTNYYGPVNVGP